MKFTNFKQKIRALTCVLFISIMAQAQVTPVSGVVKDAKTGEPVIGASILDKTTRKTVITNTSGTFTISASVGTTLVVSYIGYNPTEVKLDGKKNLVIQLSENAVSLGEVVAIGYATVKKSDATGSVTAIKPDEMNKGQTNNAQDMIVGKIAGVTVISDGGTPGGGSNIRIRGGSSVNASNDPLYVIDGMPMDREGIKGVSNPLSTINPNDIESFVVLKDASATAIYGSRASNGVIMITTKRGKAGAKPRISYNGSASVGIVPQTLDVMSANEFRTYVKNLYGETSEAAGLLGNSNTDWQKQIYQTAIGQDHNVSVNGGLKHMPYRFNVGYTDQEGVIKTSEFERYTASMNLNPSFFDDHLKMSLNLKGMFVKNRYADGGVIGAAAVMDPTQSVYAQDLDMATAFGGYWQWSKDDAVYGLTSNSLATKNPLATLMQKNDRARSTDVIANAELDYKFHFLPEMHAHLMLGLDNGKGKQQTTISTLSGSNNIWGNDGYEIKYKSNKQLTYYMQYAKEFDNQKFDVMGGYEWQHIYRNGRNRYDGIVTTVTGLDGNQHSNNQLSATEWAAEVYLVSFFGRLNYSIADQLLLTGTVRNDRSSRFSKENRSGIFPSAALAWKIKETFLKNNTAVNDLKLRLGYGITGQQDLDNAFYSYMPTYYASQTGASYPFGGTYYTSWRPAPYNKDIKWEQTTTYNAGIDLGLLNNRITAALDVYYRPTDNLLFNTAPVSQGSNFSNVVPQNVGSLYNKGIEFSVSGKPVTTKDFTWDASYNVTYNYNKVTKIYGTTSLLEFGDNISAGTGNKVQAIAEGFPERSFYVYEQVYDQNKKPIEGLYVDRNGDGVINDNDRYLFHHAAPDVTMGFTSKFMYKAFDLGFALHASIGNYVYNDVASSKANVGASGVYSNSGFLSNIATSALETNFTGKTNWYFSDYYVQNASFVRLDNVTLGYSFKKIFSCKIDGRISLTAQNVATFTKYKGLDPEMPSGIDKNIYPRPFQTVLGLNLNF